jgi:hypothetical protein
MLIRPLPQQWLTVARFTLFCALVGPALGLALVVICLFTIRIFELGHAPQGWEAGNLVWILLFYPLAVVYAGPGGAIFGAVATWFLIRQRASGKSASRLRVLSVVFGLAFGGLVMPLYFVLISPMLSGFSRLQSRGSADWLFGVLLGSLVGAMLGPVIARRLSKSERGPTHSVP